MAEIPDNAKKPSDRRKAETKNDATVTFTFDEIDYEIDRDVLEDIELAEAAERGQNLTAIAGYLGSKQWASVKEKYRNENGRVLATDLEPFFDALTETLQSAGGGKA